MGESLATKNAIAQALVDLCQEKPFRKITVLDVTKKVGLNRQTFYYHFSDKYDLLRWVYLEGSLKYLLLEELDLTNWEEQALLMLKGIKKNSSFYATTVEADADILMSEFTEIVLKVFIQLFEGIDKENLLSQKDKQFYARFFAYGCSGILIHWIQEGFEESPLEIATQLFRLAKDVEFFAYQLYEREEEE